MTVPAYTMYSSHPRLFFRDSDKTAIQTRVGDTNGWKTLYDNTIKPAATTYKGYSNAQLCNTGNPQDRFMVLLLVGWLEETGRPAGGYRDTAVDAAIYLCDIPDSDQPTNHRHRNLALALVYDSCYDWLTSTEKTKLAGEMVVQAARATLNSDEYMDGASAIDQVCALACGLALSGHDSRAEGIISRALTFWYGTGAVGGPDAGAWEMHRYSHADGACEKGSWYSILAMWGVTLLAWMLWKSTTNVDPFTTEVSWFKKCWEWYLWCNWTGSTDHDFEALSDTAKLSSPLMHFVQRTVYCILADRFPNNDSLEGGYMLRWLFERWAALESGSADACVWQVLFLDRAAVTERHPKDATTVPSCSRLFSPPGIYYCRWAPSGQADWDYDQSCVIRISARKWYWLGHPHLDSGSVMIHFKGDRLLQAPAGLYDTYGGSHFLNAYQRTWLQSLAPLVHDPSAEWRRYGTLCDNDGGQQYKKSPATNKSDPERVYWMQNDGAGEYWLRCRKFTKVSDDHPTTMTFLSADIEPGYRQKSTDAPRATVLETKYLVIYPNATNGLVWPAILYYARVVKSTSSWRVRIPFHSYNTFTSTSYGAYTTGSRSLGKLWIDVRNLSAYTKTIVPPGTPLDSNGYGPSQFKIGGDGATNWKPSRAEKSRERPDLCRNSMYIEKTTKVAQEDYVVLLMISAVGDSEPVTGRSWLADDSDWFGITLGSDTYRVHRTQDLAIHGSPDSTPPAEITALTLLARDRGILATWTDPADSDLAYINVYRRTSEIT